VLLHINSYKLIIFGLADINLITDNISKVI